MILLDVNAITLWPSSLSTLVLYIQYGCRKVTLEILYGMTLNGKGL